MIQDADKPFEQTQQVGLADETAFEASLIDASLDDAGSAIDPLLSVEGEAAADQPGWVGRQLGHFRLLRLIGRGSMGLVIQARDVNLQRIVALKVLRKQIVGMDAGQGIDQFLREARVAAQIEHPNIVRVYEISEHDGWWYIAMEMIEGDTLRNVVKAVGHLGPERACPVVADAATALAAAHESGVIHRDIKPNNVMVTRTGRGKLADFGLVRTNDPDDPFDFTDKSVGTPQYMAPEIVRQERPTTACDIYGLGGTLYFALTGHPPYTGTNIAQILRSHCEAPPPDPREHVPECPQSLAELVQRAMAKEPTQRPSAGEFAAALRAEAIAMHGEDSSIISGIGASAIGLPSPGKADAKRSNRRRRLLVGALVAGVPLIIVVGLIAWSMLRPNSNGTPTLTAPDVAAYLETTFDQTPLTYGVREAASVPVERWPAPEVKPAFGWAGKVDLGDARFVANRDGQYFWPIDAPAARLIPAPSVVGYPDEAAAQRDGKRARP